MKWWRLNRGSEKFTDYEFEKQYGIMKRNMELLNDKYIVLDTVT